MSEHTTAGPAPVPVIRLDRSRAFGTVHGDRTPEDPHYRVHFWQGGLPFDVNGLLVPDDNKTQPWSGLNAEGKPEQFKPLYSNAMRDEVAKRVARATRARPIDPEEPRGPAAPPTIENTGDAGDVVNFESYLRGEIDYEPQKLFKAYKERYHKAVHRISDLVTDLVLEEKIIPEAEVCPALRQVLPKD